MEVPSIQTSVAKALTEARDTTTCIFCGKAQSFCSVLVFVFETVFRYAGRAGWWFAFLRLSFVLLFCFAVLGLELKAYTLRHSTSPFL
jgi:hypothetical protein